MHYLFPCTFRRLRSQKRTVTRSMIYEVCEVGNRDASCQCPPLRNSICLHQKCRGRHTAL